MEKKNTVLTDEELKDVSGGASSGPVQYCEGHYTEASCRNTFRCSWRPTTANEWGGWCVPKG